MAAKFWANTAAVKRVKDMGVVDVSEQDMPPITWDEYQVAPFPDYTIWLPYADFTTFSNLTRLTMLEKRVFGTEVAQVNEIVQYLELCSALYYHLMKAPDIRGRYQGGATWLFGTETVNCIVVPLTKGVYRLLCATLKYSKEIEAPYHVETADRYIIHQMLTKVLGFCRFIEGTLTDAVQDRALISYLEDDLSKILGLIPYLRAYMFFNVGSIKDTLKQHSERVIFSKLRKPDITSQVLGSLTAASSYYMSSLYILCSYPKKVSIGTTRAATFEHQHTTLDELVVDVSNVIVDVDQLHNAIGMRHTRYTSSPTSWTEYLLRDFLETRAIVNWVSGEHGRAVGLARLALVIGEPIELSDGWEEYHKRINPTPVITEPDNLLSLLIDGLSDERERSCLKGFDIFEFLTSSDCPGFAFLD